MNNDLKPKLIMVPTDFSETAAHAIRYASALALRLDAHILVMHADFFIPAMDFMAPGAGVFNAAQEDLLRAAREQMLRHAETNIDPRIPFDTQIMVSAPVDGIMRAARESGAQLIVMGTHGRSGLPRLVVGSVTETIMRKSQIPVIAVNAASNDTAGIRRVLFPVTYTAASLAALRQAAALVNSRSAPIVLVRAINDVDDPRTYALELARLHEWVPQDLVDRCELKIVQSEATAESILAMADITHPDVIAIGIDPSRRVADVLRGTVAERVVRHSHCPVLTVATAPSAVMTEPGVETIEIVH